MADSKITALTELATPVADDVLAIVDDTGGTPVTKKIKVETLAGVIVNSAGAGTETEIQAAIDGLTSGRTWKEKVVLKGDFTLSGPITVPSYTILEIHGKLTGTSDGNGAINNADSTNTDIEIIGGHIDVDNVGGVGNKRGIIMSGVTRLTIRDVTIWDSGTHCIDILGSNDFFIGNCNLSNSGDDGISCLYSYNGRIIGNHITGGANNGAGAVASAGIEIEDGSHDLTVSGNVITGVTGKGIAALLDSNGTGCLYNLSICNNVISDCTTHGINVQNSKPSVSISSMSGTAGGGTVTVTTAAHQLKATHDATVIIENVDDSGLTILNGAWVATYVSATEFTIPATVTGTFAGDGDVAFDTLNNVVSGNVIDNCVDGINTTRTRSSTVSNNSVINCTSRGFVTGTGCKDIQVANNSFYHCGQEGILIFESDQVSVISNTIKECSYDQSIAYGISLNTSTNSMVSINQVIGYSEGTNWQRGINSTSGGTNRIFNNDVSTAAAASSQRVAATTGDKGWDNNNPVLTVTSTGAVALAPVYHYVRLYHAATAIALTIADAADHRGIFTAIAAVEPAGGQDHTITLSSGTWDGTNTVATFADINDKLVVYFDDAGNGTILDNVGAVALS